MFFYFTLFLMSFKDLSEVSFLSFEEKMISVEVFLLLYAE